MLLGITRFDLLGDFGRYNWLGNFYVVFLYNMMFAGLTSASLIKTFTWAVQRELICSFGEFCRLFQPSQEFPVSEKSYSTSFDLSCCVISFPTFGPTSPWAGLSSSDRKNTILSGKYERTGGDSGSLGDLQAHHPRPLAAHTPFTPPPNTNKSTDTPNTHIHASPFLTAPIASLHSRPTSTASYLTLFSD